ncbi:MAG: hypothetical protein QOJ35_1116 [Solirubrobacteraceae bacterium]|jgi:acetyl esterase/lipase|nr:hypothetical protein [Solirubrobacteraceae bacterium]
MSAHLHRAARAALAALTLVSLLCLAAAPAHAAAPPILDPLLNPTQPVARTAPVGGPVSADPAGPVRGTMLMVHGGGWAGHDTHARDILLTTPGQVLLDRGWRVVSIDYNEGTQGLQDVLDAAGAELARKTSGGPLCIYGESAGAHLALVAASRLRAINCVIGLGTPTDLLVYEADAAVNPDLRLRLVASQMQRFFGSTALEVARWDPVALAPEIHSDVLLLHEGDDVIVPAVHDQRFQAVRPTTQVVDLEAGDPADPSTAFVHGTISAAGRAHYDAEIGAFADRAVAARAAELRSARMGCAGTRRSLPEVGVTGLQSALRCLASKDARSLPARPGTWRRTTLNMHGEINAARIWAGLRTTTAGRRALVATARRRSRVSVQPGDRSRVTLRSIAR